MWGELRPTMRAAARDAPARRRVPAGATRSAAHRTARAAAKPQHAEQRDILGRAHTWQWRPRPLYCITPHMAPGPARDRGHFSACAFGTERRSTSIE